MPNVDIGNPSGNNIGHLAQEVNKKMAHTATISDRGITPKPSNPVRR
jgi:hypothetical protein